MKMRVRTERIEVGVEAALVEPDETETAIEQVLIDLREQRLAFVDLTKQTSRWTTGTMPAASAIPARRRGFEVHTLGVHLQDIDAGDSAAAQNRSSVSTGTLNSDCTTSPAESKRN